MEVSVTGAHEALAAADESVAKFAKSASMARHGAGAAVGAGSGSDGAISESSIAAASDDEPAVRPEPPPVSSNFVAPSDKRVKVNFGKTFSDESNVPPSPIDIVPVDVWKSDRPTRTLQASDGLSL